MSKNSVEIIVPKPGLVKVRFTERSEIRVFWESMRDAVFPEWRTSDHPDGYSNAYEGYIESAQALWKEKGEADHVDQSIFNEGYWDKFGSGSVKRMSDLGFDVRVLFENE